VDNNGQWRDMAAAVTIDNRWLPNCILPGKNTVTLIMQFLLALKEICTCRRVS
jgi:hypothetical protein